MKALSIKAKITVVSAIAVCIIGFVAVENYLTLKEMTNLAAQAQTADVLMRQHLDGDMMHDAIRADVLKATLGLKTKTVKTIQEAKSDAAEHGDRFMDNLHKNLALDLPPDIHKLFVDEEPALKAYNEQAANVISILVQDARDGAGERHRPGVHERQLQLDPEGGPLVRGEDQLPHPFLPLVAPARAFRHEVRATLTASRPCDNPAAGWSNDLLRYIAIQRRKECHVGIRHRTKPVPS